MSIAGEVSMPEPEEKPKRTKAEANRMVFTDKNVLSLRAKKKQFVVWDGGNGRGSGDVVRGLGILVSPTGAKSYRSTYYFPGSPKPHSRHLGRVGEITLEQAREQCRVDRGLAKAGKDPRSDDPSRSDSYQAVVDEYHQREQIGKKKNTSADEARRLLLRHFEDWHQRPIATIRHDEIQKRLELLRDGNETKGFKPRPYLANAVHARLQTFFAWCAKPAIGKLKFSPMNGIDRPSDSGAPRQRDWFSGMSGDKAIKTLWHIADTFGGTEGAYLKMLLLTGKRKTALANMRWEEIDDTWFWNVPQPTRKTNKRLHSIPLPSLAQRILHPRQQSGFVFPGKRDGRIEVKDAFQNKIIRAGAMEDFFLHGCRHIVETKMAEIKVPWHIRDLLLDHAPSRGSGQGYDHHHYKDEMLAALETWASYIDGLVTPQGVARLR
jgi:integrase